MKAILIPTDFSTTARNAALYAFQLAAQLQVPRVILYHAYQAPVSIDPLMPTVVMPDIDTMKASSEEAMARFKLTIHAFCKTGIQVDTLCEYNHLGNGLDETCVKTGADLIVMGITGGNALEEKLIGSNTVNVAKHGHVPVVMVPPDTIFTEVKEIMLACDYDNVVSTLPANAIKQWLDTTGARLFVLHVQQKADKNNLDMPFQSLMAETLFHTYDPIFHEAPEGDFVAAVNRFAQERRVDLIIAIPKKHGFLYELFHSSHTKQLAYHSHVPVLVMHES